MAGRAAPTDFLRAKSKGNFEEKPCQLKENIVHADSFTLTYILTGIGFYSDLNNDQDKVLDRMLKGGNKVLLQSFTLVKGSSFSR